MTLAMPNIRFYRTPISSDFMKYYNDARDMIIYCAQPEGIFFVAFHFQGKVLTASKNNQ